MAIGEVVQAEELQHAIVRQVRVQRFVRLGAIPAEISFVAEVDLHGVTIRRLAFKRSK
jgi:hypothetical protein